MYLVSAVFFFFFLILIVDFAFPLATALCYHVTGIFPSAISLFVNFFSFKAK